jgi:hypothetical protein
VSLAPGRRLAKRRSRVEKRLAMKRDGPAAAANPGGPANRDKSGLAGLICRVLGAVRAFCGKSQRKSRFVAWSTLNSGSSSRIEACSTVCRHRRPYSLFGARRFPRPERPHARRPRPRAPFGPADLASGVSRPYARGLSGVAGSPLRGILLQSC